MYLKLYIIKDLIEDITKDHHIFIKIRVYLM